MSTAAGIDIGSEAIKGIALSAGKNGAVEVIAAGTMPIADLTRMPESQDRALAIGEKLRELVKSARLRANTRRIGASGGNTSIRYLQIPPVPPWRLEMLVKYEVEERSDEKEKNCSDYHVMDVPETAGNYTVIIGMCREAFANELLAQAKTGGLGEVEIDLEALALFAAYYHGHGYDTDKTVAVVDVGADDVTVLLCKNGALYYARTFLGGGRRFTQNLADDLKLEWAEADELKKTSAEIVFDAAPAASSTVGRPRTARPAGTLNMSRTGLPGASGTGIPARSGVVAAGASGTGTGDEARRARMPEGAKLVSKPPANGGASGTVATPGASAAKSASAPVSESATPAADPSAATKAGPAPIKLSGGLDFEMLDLESDLTVSPAAPVAAKPAAPVPAPVVVPKAAPVAAKPAPAMDALDDFELQPSGDEKVVVAPAVPAVLATPGVSIAVVEPVVPAPKPTPVATPSGVEIIDLVPLIDAPKGVVSPVGVAPISAMSGSAMDMMEIPQPGVSADERDRRRRQITAALVREAASLCAAIENVVMNCKQTTKQTTLKLDRLYLTGGGSKLKGLAEFMSRRLRIEVLPLEPLRTISLTKMSPAAADELRAEQHTLGVALGLALSDLKKGAFNFQLLPQAIKDRQEFWARGAYQYYAAGAAALALGLLVYTPYTNTEAINATTNTASEAYTAARTKNEDVNRLKKENEELRQRLKTITDNIQSGDYFLNLFAELKSKNRIQDDIYLTSVTTTIPAVVIAEADTKIEVRTDTSKEPDTFQAQRRVYLRGFARGPQEGALIKPIQDFYDKLVPFPKDPDNPQNLFKDIRPIWYSKGENKKDDYYLKEFVLEAYTAAPAKESVAKLDEKKKGAKVDPKNPMGKGTTPGAQLTPPAVGPKPAMQPVQPVQPPVPQPVPPPPVEQPIQQPIQPQVEQVVKQPTVPVPGPNPVPAPIQPGVFPGIRGAQVPGVPGQNGLPVQPVAPVAPGLTQPVPNPVLPQPIPKAVPAVPKQKPVYVVPDDEPPPPPKPVANPAK